MDEEYFEFIRFAFGATGILCLAAASLGFTFVISGDISKLFHCILLLIVGIALFSASIILKEVKPCKPR